MDSFTKPKVREIYLLSPSQVGKSEFLNNLIGYIIDQDPGSILFVHPTEVDAKEYSLLRIAPMIRDCPDLRRKVSDVKSRDSGNTIKQKVFGGGVLTLCGSSEAHALASKPIRYLLLDEYDRCKDAIKGEGDPWKLARARQKRFYNAKAVAVSTPTIKDYSKIEKAYYRGTQKHWKTQCPHCGEFHEISWKQIRFDQKKVNEGNNLVNRAFNARFCCPGCGGISTEREMRPQKSKWVADNPGAFDKGVESFWLNAFCCSWIGWDDIAQEFLDSRDDITKLQTFYNTTLGETWEHRGDVEGEAELLARREEYEAELPKGVLALTCAVDTQDDRLEYQIMGHGRFGEKWNIRYGIIMGIPDKGETWSALDDILSHQYCFADGRALLISRTFIDEGGHFTQEVRQETRKRQGMGVFCIKGLRGKDTPFTDKPKKMEIVIKAEGLSGKKVCQYLGTCWQYQIGVSAGKRKVMSALRVEKPGPGYWHFPLSDDFGPLYMEGLLSEALVPPKNGAGEWVWMLLPGRKRNEPLDLSVYNLAAFRTMSFDADAAESRLLGKSKPSPEPAKKVSGSNEFLVPAVSNKGRKMGKAVEKRFDEW